jgi:hypothetical protein
MANACIFCGDNSRRLTDEHVFGNWISKYFTEELGISLEGSSELVDSDGSTKKYPMKPFQQVVKVVCKPCNEGWMRSLEESVMRDLKVMIKGQPKELRFDAQQRLASWCAKTALVLDHLHPQRRIVPDSDYSDLFRRKSALPKQVILIAFRSVVKERPGELLASVLKQPVTNVRIATDAPSAFRRQIERYASEGYGMYKVTFAIGNFAVLVFGHNFPLAVNVNSPRPVAKSIWPVSPRFTWSKDLSIDQIGGLPGFHAAFASGRENEISERVPGRLPRVDI